MTHLTEQRHSPTTGRAETADESLAVKVNSLKGMMDETRQQSTWPVKAPVVLRIIATSLIPLAYIILEELVRELWLR